MATVAEEKGDFKRVEQALDKVVKRTRNTPLRETHDIARLGNALTELGEPAKAVSLGVLPFLLGDAVKIALVATAAEAGLVRRQG